jgi:heme exporter protein A
MPNADATGLVAENLSCRRGEHEVFAGLSCGVVPGGALVLRGPNGAGKSSLLRVLAGYIRPVEGSVRWKGEDAWADPAAYRAQLHYAGHLDPLKPVLTAAENLSSLALVMGGPADVDGALDGFGLAGLRDLPVRFFSAGQRRRLNLARLLVTRRALWLLDEPTVALDTASTARIEAAIAAHRAGGGSVVIATHIGIDVPGAQVLEIAGRRRAVRA